jgi:hypothetical protein
MESQKSKKYSPHYKKWLAKKRLIPTPEQTQKRLEWAHERKDWGAEQ